jgi:hypothetical protein
VSWRPSAPDSVAAEGRLAYGRIRNCAFIPAKTIDSYSFQTYVHEIGHALGLGHGGPYNGSASYGLDNLYGANQIINLNA